jgi:hypothetical protein
MQGVRVMGNRWMSRGGYVVGKYQGFEIYRDEEDGLYWQEDGFFDCFKDVWASIDDFNADHAGEQHDDTPCLDDSFHRHEMDC